jgi:hypothetical protein
MSGSVSQTLFGSETDGILTLVHEVTAGTESTLSTVSVESFVMHMGLDLGDAMRVYWTELLQRAHLAAVGSLLRIERWVDGALAMEADQNLLGFAACLRGMVESAADTAYSLRNIPLSLAQNATAIQLALDGKVNRGVLASDEIEGELLHFQFADSKRKGETRGESHVAKRPFEYLNALDWDDSGSIRALYGELSALTHPSSQSLGSKPDSHTFGLRRRGEEFEHIHELCARHRVAINRAIVFPCNTSLLLLKLLNVFNLEGASTSAVDRLDATGIPAWGLIRSAVRKSAKSPSLVALGLRGATAPRI